ncbi:hypothetical protein AMATHDRAFT_50528 [Amanita thiersii Skay4041]|uniref:Thioesterase domain-containing protein n=1 Tax=Amanita thiersii Skay4041 TaxID=703135 RepID=A0A2A9NHD2_9AGAR|nr:hypothetical protein AMATHDRAFT_50528 [Amanita thiersii Skay4041]
MSSPTSASALAPARPRLFAHIPEVPDFDPTTVKGQLTDDEKRTAIKVYAYFVGMDKKTSFAPHVASRIKFAEMNFYGRELLGKKQKRSDGKGEPVVLPTSESVLEVVVGEDMCNSFGVMHGGCAALFLDMATVSCIVNYGIATGMDTTGVSHAMNVVYHQPARIGRKIRIVARTMSMSGRIRTARGEMWDGDVLCTSCIHSIVNVSGKMERAGGKL